MASLHDGHALTDRTGPVSANTNTKSRVTDHRNIPVLLLLNYITHLRARVEAIQHPVDDDPGDGDDQPDRERPTHEADVAEDSAA